MHMKKPGMKRNVMRAAHGRSPRGMTLVEIIVGLMLTVVILFALAPVLAQNLVMKGVFWEIRLATRVVDAQLEQACYDVGKPGATQFTALPALPVPIPAADLPPALNILNPATDAIVTWNYVEPANLTTPVPVATLTTMLRVRATVNWVSRGHPMTKTGEYFISRFGVCKPV